MTKAKTYRLKQCKIADEQKKMPTNGRMRVAFFGNDVVQCSQISHLVAEILMTLDKRHFEVYVIGEKPNTEDPVCKK